MKLVFLRTSGFEVCNASRGVLYGLTMFYVFGYAVILILGWLR